MRNNQTPTLAQRLRDACSSVRSKSYPLADLIPLMQQAADALETMQPITADGVRVSPGDKVWVNGSVDVHETRVRPMHALTEYYLYGLLPVSESFSTKKAALRARQIGYLAGKAGA